MKPRFAALVAVIALAMATGAAAQTIADFSGTWVLDAERSGPETRGISPQVSFPTELQIRQTAAALNVRTSTTRQDAHTFTYQLDGTSVTTKLPDGTVATGRAAWDGPSLVITSKRTFTSALLGEFVTEYTEVYSVASGVLTVRRTQVSDGVSLKGTAVYAKGGV